MKKVMKKFKQSLSILLAVAMVVTMVPQNTLSVAAAEPETIETTTEETGTETMPETMETDEASTENVPAEIETTDVPSETEAVAETTEAETEAVAETETVVETETVPVQTETEEVIPEETTEEAVSEEVVNDGDAESHAVDIWADENAVTVSGNNATVAGEDYVFTAVANAGYENLKVKAYTTVEEAEVAISKSEDDADTYVIASDDITDDIIIEVTADKILATYAVKLEATGVDITFVNDCLTDDGRIEEGTSLDFRITDIAADKEVTKVEYRIGDGEAVEIKPVSQFNDRFYSVSEDKITGDITIIVTTIDVIWDVSFNVTGAKVFDVTDAENKQEITGTLQVHQGDCIYFVVEPDEGRKVSKVIESNYAEEYEIEPYEGGVYCVGPQSETIITVTTELDESQCNTLTFAVDGHKSSYTATVSGNTVSGNDLSAGKTFSAGDTELIANGTIGVGLNIASGYELDKVEVVVDKKATVIEETDGYYNVSFTDNKNATLKVYTSPVGTEAAKKVVFANSASHMDYKVTTSETVKLEAGKKHTYTVAEGTKYINFTVTATGNYEPVVTLSNGTTPEFTKGAAKNGKTPYTYSVAANLIAENETVKISETIENKNVTVSFVEDEVEITSASIGGKEVSADDGTYKVPYGATITFAVAAYDNCKITKAVTTAAGATKAKNEKVKANGFTFTVKATADSETVITSEALDTLVVHDNTYDEAMSAVKNAYTVEYNNYYEITVRHGAYGLATIKDVKVKAGNADAKTSVEENDEDIWTSAELHISKEDAGKKLTVSVTIADGENEKVLTTTLNVLPVIKKVTIAGVKSGKLSQTADTEKEYKITLDPKKAANSLAAEVTAVGETPTEADIEAAKKAVSANVIDGKLVIRTNITEAKENVAVVKLYDVSDSTKDVKSYVEGGTFTVSTTAPALVNTKPSVALKSSDDTTLTLTLGAKKVETPVNGKVYYKVEVTPQTVEGTETPAAITEATANPVYVEKKKTADSQEIKVVVNSNSAGKGQAWKYDVKVTLVQTKDDTAITKDNEESITAFKTAEGKEGTKKDLATKNPYYETNLKLKKGTTTVYTGQNDVLVATAQFGKNTTFTNITAKDATYAGYSSLNVSVEGNQILVTANNNTATGKHTIEVVTVVPETMEPAKATITVNVVKGIENLSVAIPTNTLYKADKKAATLTAQAVYNSQDEMPKTKKVTWSILDADGNVLSEDDYLYGMITVKNGKVTVNKNYIVSENEADNQFKVKVEAADFEENKVTGVSGPITITSETAELGEVVIVRSRYDSELDGLYYDVVARSGSTLTADTVYNDSLQTVVLKKGVAEKDSYPSDELVSNVTFSSSNKALQINAYGQVTDITKQAKNVKITATANDGSKNKAVLDKLNVSYAETTELGLKVDLYDAKEDTYYEVSGPEQKEVEYNGTTNSMFELQVKQLTEDGWNELYGLTNYKLNVKGAKVIYSDPMSGWYTIVATGETATITLTDKSKKGDEAVKVYTLKNNALSTNKAPKLKASGNLIAGEYFGTQTITYTLPTGKNAYDYKDKYVMVTVDRVEAAKAANYYRYKQFSYYGKELNGYMPVNEDGTIELSFGDNYINYIPAGSYKLWFSFGTINEDGDFIADTKATAVTLKAVAPKTVKESFKFATSYKMSVKEGATVAFTGSGKGIALPSLYCKTIKNANVNGEENKFLDYFELTEGGRKLKLKAGVDASAINKKDLTGYVDYWITTDTYYMENTAKITVSFVDLTAKYAASNATVLEDTVTVADVTVTANKALANVGFAYVTDGDFGVTSVNGAVITLTYNGEGRPTVSGNAAGKKHKVTMYVVPANSYYTTELTALKAAADAENATDEAKKAYTDAVQKYGVKVTSTITVKAKDVKGKISIAKKALTQKFTNGSYSHGEQNYTVIVPYTKNVPCQITNVKFSNDLFGFGGFSYIEDGTTFLRFTVNKPALAAAVEAGTVKYGETVKGVKATVKFADDAIDETFTFKFTLPNEAEMTYEEAVKAVEAAKADIEAAVVPDYWKGITEQEIIDSTYSTGIWGVCGEIVNLVPADSDTAIIMTQWNGEAGTCEVNANDFTAPTSQTAGKLTVKARLTSTAPVEEGQQAPSTDITFDLTIPATGMEPKDVEAKLNAFVSANLNGYATNLTTQEEVAADLREAAGLASNLRLMVTNFEMYKATQEGNGELYVDFVITDIKYGAEPYEMNVYFNIDKLKTTDEAVTAVQAAVSGDALAELVKSNDAETVKTAVLEAANAAVNADGYTVAYATTGDVSGNNAKPEDVFSFVPATYKEEGKVSFTLVITDAEGNELENTVKVDETVAKNTSLQTLKEAKADILSALETFEATNSTTADEVKAAAAKAVVNEAIALDYKTTKSDVSGNDVSGNDATEASFEIIEATVDAEGKVKGTFVLTMGTETMEVAFEITIPKLA